MKKSKLLNKDVIYVIAEIIIIIAMVLPVLTLSFYTVPSADDFYTMNAVKNELLSGRSALVASVTCTWNRYVEWGGFFTAQFLNFIVNPYLHWGMTGHHIIIAFINFFFVVSLWVLVRYCLRILLYVENLKVQLAFYIMSLFIFLNLDYNSEIYFWYCVTVSYFLIVGLMMWGIVLHIKAVKEKKIIWSVLAFIVGLLVSGGALNVAALNCGIGFIIFCSGILLTKRIKYSLSGFMGSFIGAIINVAAPGNFTRHEGLTGTYPVIWALRMGTGTLLRRIYWLLCSTPFVLLLVGVFVLSLKYIPFEKIKIKFRLPAIPFLIIFAGGVIINFPVYLGYATGYFPDRCVFIEDCIIYLGFIVSMIYLAGWSRKEKNLTGFGKESGVCIIIAVLLFICHKDTLEWGGNCLSILCINEIKSGRANAHLEYWQGIFTEIEQSEEQEVIIVREEKEPGNIFYTTGLNNEADSWINSLLAAYYDKESIVLEGLE